MCVCVCVFSIFVFVILCTRCEQCFVGMVFLVILDHHRYTFAEDIHNIVPITYSFNIENLKMKQKKFSQN